MVEVDDDANRVPWIIEHSGWSSGREAGMSEAVRVLVRAVERFHREHTEGGRTGCAIVVQRFGSALNLNVRFHIPFLDGEYARQPD